MVKSKIESCTTYNLKLTTYNFPNGVLFPIQLEQGHF